MRIFKTLLSAYLCFLLAPGCNLINPAEKVPTYVRIDSFQFIGDSSRGSSSQHITNVRINFDNQTVGVFDLPATVPILADRRGVVSLTPGVAYDGLTDVQVSYPFFMSDTITIDPAPGKTLVLKPKTKYFDTTVFGIDIIDFEGRYYPFATRNGADTHGLDSLDVFEGNYCGRINMSNRDELEVIMNRAFTSTSQGFVELNYKCSVPFAIGLQSIPQGGGDFFTEYLIGVKPSSQWKKIYVALADFIFKYPQRNYWLVIKAMPDTDAGGYVALDNVKILRAK